jgi:hypothetical protein
VIVWRNIYEIAARRFNSTGGAVGPQFQVNAYIQGTQRSPEVGSDADGDFVVVWQSGGQDGYAYGIFARRFSSAGSALASEFQVGVFTADSERYPAVSVRPGGDFVVAWQSGRDGSPDGVFARFWSSAGVALGSEFQVNVQTADGQGGAAVGIDSDGELVVTWASYSGQDGDAGGIFGRRFDAAATPLTGEFPVNVHTTGTQQNPAVSMSSGRFVVSWNSEGQDGSANGVFARRYASLAVLDIDGNGSTAALTDGLLVLRFLFGFTGATLTAGAVDAVACTRCNAAAIGAYLETLI